MTPANGPRTRASDDEMAQDILNYLASHPRAMDTIEGVAEWWLLRERVRVVAAQVERVLRRLTEQGALETVGAGDARCYRRRAAVPEDGADE